jgi:hypothetical protein
MPHSLRTMRDRTLSEFLKKFGPMSNADLARKAAEHPHFSKLQPASVDKYVDRFVDHYEYLGILAQVNGRLEWLPQSNSVSVQSAQEKKAEQGSPAPTESVHESVQRLLRGMSNGSITLKPKSPFKELNRIKGDLFDEFMADIDSYNLYKNTPLISSTFEKRIYNMALKLRTYGFIEEKQLSQSMKDNRS